jgi:hypothetical protein
LQVVEHIAASLLPQVDSSLEKQEITIASVLKQVVGKREKGALQ